MHPDEHAERLARIDDADAEHELEQARLDRALDRGDVHAWADVVPGIPPAPLPPLDAAAELRAARRAEERAGRWLFLLDVALIVAAVAMVVAAFLLA